mmetsp:Transcript_22432/g.47178  ORF Transcript_22432/g.47178 Transcript_22432/m.47178 type:complete len:243 (-) Transcript_22432:1056-1784(-)
MQILAETLCANVQVGLILITFIVVGAISRDAVHKLVSVYVRESIMIIASNVVKVVSRGDALEKGDEGDPRGVVDERGVCGQGRVAEEVLRQVQVRVILRPLLRPHRLEPLPGVGQRGVISAAGGPAQGEGAVQELAEVQVRVPLVALHARLPHQVAHLLSRGRLELGWAELMNEDPDIVLEDHAERLSLVHDEGQLGEGDRGQDDVLLRGLDLLERLVELGLRGDINAVAVDAHLVGAVAAA